MFAAVVIALLNAIVFFPCLLALFGPEQIDVSDPYAAAKDVTDADQALPKLQIESRLNYQITDVDNVEQWDEEDAKDGFETHVPSAMDLADTLDSRHEFALAPTAPARVSKIGSQRLSSRASIET